MERTEFVKYAVAGAGGAVLTAVFLVGVGAFFIDRYPHQVSSLLQPAVALQAFPTGESNEERVIAAVEKANPAVVAITVSKYVPIYERYYRNESFGPFGFFFTVPEVRQRGTELQEVGGGSGFLVSADGYIVTNRHVVRDADATYTVFTNDGEKYEASVIARDTTYDVAVLKIEGTDFGHLQFGNSDELRVGQSVVAIGNALAEFRNTVSVGVVSGLSRSITATSRYGAGPELLSELIQTDAAINEGNSGGPLLNLEGEVIGVNVAIVSGAQNVGFALSANSVAHIVQSVQQTGRIVRPFLGVRYVPVTQSVQEELGLSVDYGAYVVSGASDSEGAVVPGSPADKAGILAEDIILEIDGERIDADHSLGSLLLTKRVGDTITVRIMRNKREQVLQVTLEELKQ